MRNRHRLSALFLCAAALVLYATSAFAHAVVFPRRADPGAYEKYVLRVPNERDIETTRVEIRFPASVRVVSFADVQGWKLEVITDSAKSIVGAVWTGTLPAQRFVEFPFVAVNPKEATDIVWPTFQTYADGEKVEWTGAEGSDRPASVTHIAAADAPAATDHAQPAADVVSTDRVTPVLAIVAAVLALVALGVALRKTPTGR
jgi:uncharacterized protein YcnI